MYIYFLNFFPSNQKFRKIGLFLPTALNGFSYSKVLCSQFINAFTEDFWQGISLVALRKSVLPSKLATVSGSCFVYEKLILILNLTESMIFFPYVCKTARNFSLLLPLKFNSVGAM